MVDTMINPAPAFLDVERSLSGQRWLDRLDQAGRNRALAMAQSFAMPEIVARVLSGRGVEISEAEGFLTPSLKTLMPDPSTLTDMDRGVERLAEAIAAR
jgi:single-stranded-DNA-specific exonuclease